MRATPRTDDRWADAAARPSKQGDWRYVAEEMARLCRELEQELTDYECGTIFERLNDRNDSLSRRIDTLEYELKKAKDTEDEHNG